MTARALFGLALALALALVVAMPFAPSLAPGAIVSWLAAQYSSGQDLYPFTSYFAENVWTLASPPVSDALTVAGVTLRTWGWLLVALIEVACLVTLRRARSRDGRRAAIVGAWYIVLFAFFVFATRMHERYLAYALFLAPILASYVRAQRLPLVACTVAFVANVALAMLSSRLTAGSASFERFAPLASPGVIHAVSAFDVIAFVVSFAIVLREPGTLARLVRPRAVTR